MKRAYTALAILTVVVMIACIPLTCCAQEGRVFHSFLGLAFGTATPDDVEQALLDNYGVGWDPTYSYPHLSRGVTAFGHEFSFGIEFNANEVGITRIYLSPADRSIWSDNDEEFTAMLERDIADFILLDELISAEYGQPDVRFFRTDGEKYGSDSVVKAMFTGGQWNADEMMEQIRADRGTMSFSLWGNVVLQYWVIWRDEGPKKSKSCLDVYYYDTVNDLDADTIAAYPPVAD
ncbi:MAG TPA: hypothetical protein PK537_03950 [Candidatus Limiplasma sp.]|nr:hypothetical protein [Candidatus Limiplasma sp.]